MYSTFNVLMNLFELIATIYYFLSSFDISTLNITIYLLNSSSFPGLCGTYDNDKSNDFLTLGGTLVRDEKEFALTWRFVVIYYSFIFYLPFYLHFQNHQKGMESNEFA